MEWNCLNFNCNRNKIEPYNVLIYRENQIKKLKKICKTKEDFSAKLKLEFQCQYWSRCEYELILSNKNNRIILSPWVGSRNPEAASIDVTDRIDFDWVEFAKQYVNLRSETKIDIWDQLLFKWNELVNYCWNYHHKYQRKNLKSCI